MVDESQAQSRREFVALVYGHTEALVVGLLAVVVTAVLAWSMGVDAIPTRIAFGLTVAAILYAAFLAFHDVRIQRDKFRDRLELLAEPKFELAARTAFVHQTAHETHVFPGLTLVNEGADSAIAAFNARYNAPNESIPAILLHPTSKIEVSHNQEVFVFDPNEGLHRKIGTMLQRGGMAIGRLALAIPGQRKAALESGEGKIIVTVSDYRGRESTCIFVASGPSTDGITYMGGEPIPEGTVGRPMGPKAQLSAKKRR